MSKLTSHIDEDGLEHDCSAAAMFFGFIFAGKVILIATATILSLILAYAFGAFA